MGKIILAVVVVALLCTPALADWDPGDPDKMHFPQLPDPDGWDVKMDLVPLGDDFMCMQSGYINDIHIWASWREDVSCPEVKFSLSIWADDRTGQYSMPGAMLWETPQPVPPDEFRLYGTGDQGWLGVDLQGQPLVLEHDHVGIWQYNFYFDDAVAFRQDDGAIYWLVVKAFPETAGTEIGWKTSLEHWEDDAVVDDPAAGWVELFNPLPPNESLDLAFVITPEPTTLALLGLGGLGVLLRRRRT